MLARVRGYGADGFSSRFGPGRDGDRRGHALTARDMRQRVSMDRNRKHGWCKRCTRQPIIKSRSMAATAGAGAIPAVDNDRLKTGSRTPAMQCRRAVSPGSDDQVRQRSTPGAATSCIAWRATSRLRPPRWWRSERGDSNPRPPVSFHALYRLSRPPGRLVCAGWRATR